MHDVLLRLVAWFDGWLQVLLYLCSVALCVTAPLLIGILCYFVNVKVRKRPIKKENYFITQNRKGIVIIIVVFLVGAVNAPFQFFNCGNTGINSCFEKRHYVEDYYVFITDNRSNATRYKLRATIEKTSPSVTEEYYFVKNVYWENGGHLTFSGDGKIGEEVRPNKETRCTDYKDEVYYITLTTEKAN